MANRYWVGGTGTWNASNTANWSATSGGAGGASVPGAADAVIFDTASGSGNYTVTVSSPPAVVSVTQSNPTGGTVNVSFSSGLTTSGAYTLNSGTMTLNNNAISPSTFSATSTATSVIDFGSTGAINVTAVSGTVLTLTSASLTYPNPSNYVLTGAQTGATARTVNVQGVNTGNYPNITVSNGTATLAAGNGVIIAANQSGTNAVGSITTTSGYTGPVNITSWSTNRTLQIYGSINLNSATTGLYLVGDNAGNGNNPVMIASSGTTTSLTVPCNIITSGAGNTLVLQPATTGIINVNVTSAASAAAFTMNGTGTITISAIRSATTTISSGTTNLSASGGTVSLGTTSQSGGTVNVTAPATASSSGNNAGYTISAGTLNVNNTTLTTAVFTATSGGATSIDFSSTGAINITATTSLTVLGLTATNVTYPNPSNYVLTGATTGTVTRTVNIVGANAGNYPNITVNNGSGTLTYGYGVFIQAGQSGGCAIGSFTTTSGYTGPVAFASNSSGRTLQIYGSVNINSASNGLYLGGDGAGNGNNPVMIAPAGTTTNCNIACNILNSSSGNTLAFQPASTGVTNINMTSSSSVATFTTTASSAGTVNVNGFTTGTFNANGGTTNFNITAASTATININATTSAIAALNTSGTTTIASTANVTLSNSVTSPTALNFNGGTISLSGYDLSVPTFTSTTGTRAINFGTGNINVTSTASGVVFNLLGTSFSYTGTPNVKLTGNAASGITRTVTVNTGFTASNAVNILVTAGQAGSIVTFTTPGLVRTLDFTGATASTLAIANILTTVYGSLVLPSVVTLNGTSTFTFAGTTTGNRITTNGISLPTTTFNGAGGEWILQDNATTAYAITLTAGTLNLNNKSYTTAVSFTSNNSNVRSINFGTSGKIQVTTGWDTTTTTNMTIQGNSRVEVRQAGASAVTVNAGSITNNPINVYFLYNSAGTVTATVAGNIGTLDTSGMSAGTLTFASSTMNIYGSLNLTSNANLTGASTIINMLSPNAGNTIAINGASMTGVTAINFNGAGTWTFTTAMTAASAVITHNNGTINTAGFAIAAASYAVTAPTVAVLNAGASTFTFSGTGATIAWNVNYTTGSWTMNGGTSTIVCSGASPTFNGNGGTYYNVTFSNASALNIAINGANTFNNLTLTALTAAAYTPVVLGGNQTVNGIFSISGSTTGNCRYFIRSSVLDTRRTFTAATVTNLSDVDFRDIIAAGAGTWSGTRIGDAGNNTGITFTAAKTVFWSTASASSGGNWSSANWSTVSAATPGTAASFPLPQDTVSTGNGSSAFALTLDFSFNIGSWTFNAGGFSAANAVTIYLMGNIDITIVSGGGITGSTFANMVFYNRTSATRTFSYKTLATGTLFQWPFPIFINTNGTVQFTNMSYNNVATINKLFSARGGVNINHVQGTLQLQDNTVQINAYDSSYSGNTRNLDMGSSNLTIQYNTDTTQGFVVQTSGYTLTPGTSTLTMSGTWFGIISDGNLSFNNISITSMGALALKLIGSASYINNASTQTPIAITANNFTTAGNSFGFNNAVIQFSGVSNLTLTGTLTLGAGAISPGISRQMLMSLDIPVTITAPTVAALTDIDFSGITAAGASAPWSGTRLGNAGGNSNITFPAPKTVYAVNAVGGSLTWYNPNNWSNTSGGTANSIYFPLAQDTAVISDTTVLAGTTFNIGYNYALPFIDLSGRTTRIVTFNDATNGNIILLTANLTLNSNVTWSASTPSTWYFTGDSTQTINTASKTWLQPIKILTNSSVQLGAAFTTTNTSGVQLIEGDLNLNNFALTTPVLTAIRSLTKSMTFGSSGSVAINGNAGTVLSIPTIAGTNFSTSGTSAISLTYSGATGTRVVDLSGINTAAKSMSVSVNAGSGIVTVGTSTTSSGVRNFSTQGFTGTISHASPLNLYGNYVMGSGVTTIQSVSFNYLGTGASTLTTNGKTLRGNIVVNSVGGSFTQADALVLTSFGGALSSLQLVQGTYNTGNFNTTLDRFNSTGTNTRTISMGTGTWTITASDSGTNYSWDVASGPSLSILSSTSTIVFSGSGTNTFNGGDKTYFNMSINNGGINNINGFNTFNTLTNGTRPTTILFGSGNSVSFTTFSVTGALGTGNRVTIGSTGAVPATLYKSTAWNVGVNSTLVGSTGFNLVGGSGVDYLTINNLIGTNTPPPPPAVYASGASFSGGYSITF